MSEELEEFKELLERFDKYRKDFNFDPENSYIDLYEMMELLYHMMDILFGSIERQERNSKEAVKMLEELKPEPEEGNDEYIKGYKKCIDMAINKFSKGV